MREVLSYFQRMREEELWRAAMKRDVKTLTALLKKGVNPNVFLVTGEKREGYRSIA